VSYAVKESGRAVLCQSTTLHNLFFWLLVHYLATVSPCQVLSDILRMFSYRQESCCLLDQFYYFSKDLLLNFDFILRLYFVQKSRLHLSYSQAKISQHPRLPLNTNDLCSLAMIAFIVIFIFYYKITFLIF